MHVNGSSDTLPIATEANDLTDLNATPRTKRPARTFKFAISKDADATSNRKTAELPASKHTTFSVYKDNMPSRGVTRTNCQGNDAPVTTAEDNVIDRTALVSKAAAQVSTNAELAFKISAALAATNAEMAERALATDALVAKLTNAAPDVTASLADDILEHRRVLQAQYDALVRKTYGEEHTDSERGIEEHRLLLAHAYNTTNTTDERPAAPARGAFQNAAGLVIKWCLGVAAAIVVIVFATCVVVVFATCVLVAACPWIVELVESLPCMQ